MFSRIALTAFSIFLLAACSSPKSADKTAERDMMRGDFPSEITLEGQIQNTDVDEKVILYKIENGGREEVAMLEVDDDGKFSADIKVPSPGFYVLNIYNKQEGVIILGEEDLEILVDGQHEDGIFEIKNSRDNDLYAEFMELQKALSDQMGALRMEYQQTSNKDSANQAFNDYVEEATSKVKTFINKSKGSIVSLLAVEMLDPEKDMDLQVKVAESLYEMYPQSELVKSFKKRMDAAKSTAIGSVAPEISLQNPEGDVVSLSSLRGKYVLIDFWASWCGPCRRENPNVVKMYNEYKSRGFEIYGVSLDKDREAWLKAIEKDQLSWVHVSDLQFWQSEAAKAYNVGAIPMTFLIGQDGRIIAKNLRGKALEQKLEDLGI